MEKRQVPPLFPSLPFYNNKGTSKATCCFCLFLFVSVFDFVWCFNVLMFFFCKIFRFDPQNSCSTAKDFTTSTQGIGHGWQWSRDQPGRCLVTRNGTERAHSSLEMMGCNKIISTWFTWLLDDHVAKGQVYNVYIFLITFVLDRFQKYFKMQEIMIMSHPQLSSSSAKVFVCVCVCPFLRKQR